MEHSFSAPLDVQLITGVRFVKNIVFDVGNVLLSFQPEAFLKAHWKDAQIRERLNAAIFGSDEWVMLDRGMITARDAWAAFAQRNPDIREDIEKVGETWMEMFSPMSETIALAARLRDSGHALFYLSNMHERSARYICGKFPFWSLFRGGIYSYAEKTVKPERKIYEIFLSRFALRPQDCVFIDDMPCNVSSAEDVGMAGILYKDGNALKELKEEIARLEGER